MGRRNAVGTLLAIIALGLGAPVAHAQDEELVRVVVQLEDEPLAKADEAAQARTVDGHLDVKDPESREYLADVAVEHESFEDRLAQAAPGARVQWRYKVAFNGLALELPAAQLAAVRQLPGVVNVTETYDIEPELDETRSLIGLPALWQSLPRSPLGAGAGTRIALIDAGVNPNHPFFNPAGFTAPAGYPKSQRVAGGVRTNLPLTGNASNKVIVNNVYGLPGDTTSLPYGAGSRHGTHVAGILAGVEGDYSYGAFPLRLSGIAPGAQLMSYTYSGDSAEFIAAIEDVVADQADALNISLGHSRWLTTDPAVDPIRKALDAAVDAGVVVVGSSGNAGANGDSNATGSWKLSPKVITVGNSSHGRLFSNAVTVTGPGTPPATLTGRPAIAALPPAPPITATISGEYVVAPGGTAGNAGEACTALPPGTFDGKIALVARGTCSFEIKKNVIVAAGAKAWVVQNNVADTPIAMAQMTAPVPPGVMVTLSDGRALVAWAAANPAPTLNIEGPVRRLTTGWPDVVAASSSRGPGPNMEITPDLVAPGTSVLSSVVEDVGGTVTTPLFDLLSGTSMAAPHVTALAALTGARHPGWTPAQIKSALMNTANTSVWLDLDRTLPALAKHRGAGRVNAARLVDPQLTFAPASTSFGMMRPNERKRLKLAVTDMRSRGRGVDYAVRVRPLVGHAAVRLTAPRAISLRTGDRERIDLELTTVGAPVGDYEGFIEVTGGGQSYTLPYFVRVQDPAVIKDVLLIDWDRNVGSDFRPAYTAALNGLGLSHDVFDGGVATAANGNPGPTYAQLQNYRAVVLFTGNNTAGWSAAHTGGSFPLQDYLVAGGKLLLTGQDVNTQYLYNQNVGSDFVLAGMAGWVTGIRDQNECTTDRDLFGAPVPADAQLETAFTLLGRTGDVSVNLGGDGANNQRAPDAGRTVLIDDGSNWCLWSHHASTVGQNARVLGRYTATKLNGVPVTRVGEAVATGVAPDPTLAQPDPQVSWSAAILHVGAEGLNANRGELALQTALGRLHAFLTDKVTVTLRHHERWWDNRVTFVARTTSARGGAFTTYRWDFGDGSPIVETSEPRVQYDYGRRARGRFTARVEAVNELTRSSVGSTTVRVR